MIGPRPLTVLSALAVVFLLGACAEEEERLPGERISVLTFERALEPDPRLAGLEVRLPRPQVNSEWPQSGGYPHHAMHHLAARDRLGVAWDEDIGEGSDDEFRLLSAPVIGDRRIFAVDAAGRVTAFAAASGERLWHIDLRPESEEDSVFSGGLGYAMGRLYVTTGHGVVFCLEAASGQVVWRLPIGAPIRAAPTISGGRVFVLTYDNQLFVLAADRPETLWSHAGIVESAGLLGSGSPAVASGIVVAPYSSGELYALAVESGRVVWVDTLSYQRPIGGLSLLNDIRGSPVIDRDAVYAIAHNGKLVGIDLRTGTRLWEQDISGVHTPWVAGDYLFVLSAEGDLVCIARNDGRIRWVTTLPRWMDPDDHDEQLFWSGPVLVADRLLVVGSNGMVLSVSPYSGELMGRLDVPDPVSLVPVVAEGTIYVLTEEAELIALR